MEIKIKSLRISGIRGVKDDLRFQLDGRSLLLYGDNGSGKSSISDSIEWFYTNRVTHLSSTEIDLKEALRNAEIEDDQDSEVALEFLKGGQLSATRSIFLKRGKLNSAISNDSEEFNLYIDNSTQENLLLRYQFLRDFIDNTKGDKLKYLSDIIGFSEVTKKKDVLRKSYNSIKTEIKTQNFEAQITTQKETLIEKIGAAVSREEDLIEVISKKVSPLNTNIEVKCIGDLDKLLEHLSKTSNNKLSEELGFLERVNSSLINLNKEIGFINAEYEKYYQEFKKIADDVEAIMQTFLSELLKTGANVLTKKFHTEESCPLCLNPKNIEELQKEIAERLKAMNISAQKKASFDKSKNEVDSIIQERIKRIDVLLLEKLLENEENKVIKLGIAGIKKKLVEILKACTTKVTSGEMILDKDNLGLKTSDFEFQGNIEKRIKVIKATLEKDNTALIHTNISSSKDAFLKIKAFEKQRKKLESQRKSLEVVYNEFIKVQKDGLEDFINTFSESINGFYQYMNPGEPFQEIKIETIGDEDELNGLTIAYQYNGNRVSPPQKYFSESHLNCYGLAFFLASVMAFNEKNKFIVLDDVISSFDTNHRKRFAELLFEKFSDYQIILLTHELDWFKNMVSPIAKQKNWIVNEIKWSETKGTYLDETPIELKERIEISISEGKIEGLGNPLRIYLEHLLKQICLDLDVKVSFRFNDQNEKRMPDELINALKSRIKEKSTGLKEKLPTIDRVASSGLFGNLLSHDNPFEPRIGDLRAFWSDIKELEGIFICSQEGCRRPKVSFRNYNIVTKEISCGCGFTKYDWK